LAGGDDGVAEVGVARGERDDKAFYHGAVSGDVVAVQFPHGVVCEDEGEVVADGDAESGVAHEEGLMGVDDIGCEVRDFGGEQAGHRHAHGHVASVEFLYCGDSYEAGLIVAGVFVAGGDDEDAVALAAEFIGECLDGACHSADVGSKRICHHEYVHTSSLCRPPLIYGISEGWGRRLKAAV